MRVEGLEDSGGFLRVGECFQPPSPGDSRVSLENLDEGIGGLKIGVKIGERELASGLKIRVKGWCLRVEL